jgi:tRNA nucleotidyltransferase/poly(A) polymerase
MLLFLYHNPAPVKNIDATRITRMPLIPPLPPFIPPDSGAYLVGGCVRDLLLGRSPADWDVAVEGSPAGYAAIVAAALGGRVVAIGKPGRQTWRAAAGERIVDVRPIQGDGIRADLLRRDFTINAMAVATDTGEVLDVAGGREDLAARTIRMVSRSGFRSDPVRLIRTFRFAAQLGFTVETGTRDAVREDAGLVSRSAGERLRDELYKLLGAEYAAEALTGMTATGLLEPVLPELGAEAPVSTERSIRAMRELNRLYHEGMAGIPQGDLLGLLQEFTARRRMLLKFALLLHPLGSDGQAGREAVFNRLRCPNRDRDLLARLLDGYGTRLRMFETLTPREEVRLFLSAGETAFDMLLMDSAWARSDPHLTPSRAVALEARLGGMLHRCWADYRPRRAVPGPLTGDDLISEFGLRPSPLIQKLLRWVEEEKVLRGTLSRADALIGVRQVLEREASSPPGIGGEP